jgi:hypothetical protein
VPQGSQWFKYEDYVKPRLGVSGGRLELIFEAVGGGNVLTTKAIRDMFRVKASVDAVRTQYKGITYTLADVCWTDTRGALPSHIHGVQSWQRAGHSA